MPENCANQGFRHKLRHPRIISKQAAGYTRWGGELKNARYINLRQTIGSGNIASTAEDLLRWQQALFFEQLLKPESLQQMMVKGKLKNGKTFD